MRRLGGQGGELDAAAFVAGLDLASGGREGRPRVVAIMIASVDGRATIDGKSTKLGHPEDRALLRSLRADADCVLAGTGTIGAEGYANLLDPPVRAAREAAGRPPHPIVATLSRSGAVPWEAPVFAEAGVPKVVFSGVPLEVPAAATEVSVSSIDSLPRALSFLAASRAVRSVACEGGPGLLRALLAEDLVDDLLLTLAPLLVGGDGPTSLRGEALAPPPRMALRDALRADDHLFLHYAR